MLFNSIVFILLFLPITHIIYFLLLKKRVIVGAKTWLVLASLFFYGYWKVSYLPIMLFSILFNFTIGKTLSFDAKNIRINQKFIYIFGIIANILFLGYFKYTDFFIENINLATGSSFHLPNILLPLAISFFTFQQIAYISDSYKGLTKEYDFLTYTLFITFFPQQIAGPIVHHKEMMPQFYSPKNLVKRYKNITTGLFIFTIGLFKKVMIADTVAIVASKGFSQAANLNIIEAWFSSLSYTMQIYYDFSGYCDMAIGTALMFNINLPINFFSPYKALNIQDFWKRWHITLSKFLRDYIYIPLGGSRVNLTRNCFNLMMVFIIGGFWHGASWTFIIWGIMHGCATVIHKLWQFTNIKINKFLAWFITFNFINLTWIFFKAENFQTALNVIKNMFNISSIKNIESYKPKFILETIDARSADISFMLFAMIIAFFAKNSIELLNSTKIDTNKKSWIYGIMIGALMIFLIGKMIFVPFSEFIYFNF